MARERTDRPLPYWLFGLVVVVYLAIIQVGGIVSVRVADVHPDDALTTTRGLLATMVVPLGAALAFTYGVVAALGRLRSVLIDDRPVQRWVVVVPLVFVASVLLATDYGALSQQTAGFVLVLVLATQMVGWGEEGMFRGLGVTVLREHGLTEGRVALVSSLVFGLVHLTNAVGRGAEAIPQALAVSFAGYFFYLTRRWAGSNAVNSVVHGLFDMALLSGTVILVDQTPYVGGLAAILAYVVAGVVVRRRHVETAGRER